MEAIGAKDQDKVKSLAEPTLAGKIIDNFSNTRDLKYEPPTGDGKSFLVDKMFIKGMNMDRKKNDTNFDYLYVSNMEKFGLRSFIHKYNTGQFHYYLMRDFKETHFSKFND